MHEVVFKAVLADLSYEWSVAVEEVGPGDIWIAAAVPREAWLHPEAQWHVTELRAIAVVGGVRFQEITNLYWPGGRWRAAQMVDVRDLPAVAPAGVIGGRPPDVAFEELLRREGLRVDELEFPNVLGGEIPVTETDLVAQEVEP